MPRKKYEKKDPIPCTNCQGPVQPRKPSENGLHYCSEKPCANAKQKKYRELRIERLAGKKATEKVDAVALLIQTFLQPNPLKTCSGCGAERVLAGWVHRTLGDATKSCHSAGARGPELGASGPALLDIAMPHLTPTAQKLAAWEAEQAAKPAEPEPEVPKWKPEKPAPIVIDGVPLAETLQAGQSPSTPADEGIPVPGLPPF